MSIVAIGLSYRTAPVDIREGVAVLPNALGTALKRLSSLPGISECAMLSTCNRSETYLVSDEPETSCRRVIDVLSELSQLDSDALRKHLFIYQDTDAVRHLFEVSSGLDSMIMGEPQIAGQVKDAGSAAMEAGSSGAILNRLFRSATEASKRARTETEIGVGAVSVSFAAVELAKKIFGSLEGRSTLILGAGEMSELTAKHLVEAGVGSLVVASRTLARATDLADRVNGEAVPWENAVDRLHESDVVISATGAEGYVLSSDDVAGAMQIRRNRSMFLIDIAIPRDIEPAAGELYNVFLYDIDNLEAAVGANLKKRQEEAEKARVILDEVVAEFNSWMNSLGVVPAIVALRKHFQETLESELDRAKLADLNDDQRSVVLDLLRRYTNKLLHQPVTRLKEVADDGDGMTYVATLMHLFELHAKLEPSDEQTQAMEKTG